MHDGDRALLYRQMVLTAWEDRTLTRDERRILDTARETLGLPAEEAHALELQVYRDALKKTLPEDVAELKAALGISDAAHRVLSGSFRVDGTAFSRHFEVVRELGRGGFGRALLARDRSLDRDVVVKQPLGLLASSEDERALFLHEARVAAKLHHPNVVTIYQVVMEEEPPVLVMEYVAGESLEERFRTQGILPEDEVARIGLDVLAGLAAIHERGVIHRDIKPGNILLTPDGVAKVTDFGVAHTPVELEARQALEATGFTPGSPLYMSPEQFEGEPVDARSDLYSLGVVLRELLTGDVYLDPEAPKDYRRWLKGEPEEVRELSTPWEEALARALVRDPADRYADAGEMAAAVRELRSR